MKLEKVHTEAAVVEAVEEAGGVDHAPELISTYPSAGNG
jgi:hypothetical protein